MQMLVSSFLRVTNALVRMVEKVEVRVKTILESESEAVGTIEAVEIIPKCMLGLFHLFKSAVIFFISVYSCVF